MRITRIGTGRMRMPNVFLTEAAAIKYSSLVVLVIQNCSLVLFMRYAMTGNRPKFLKAMSVFFAEVFKFVASVTLVCLEERSLTRGLSQIADQFLNHWRDALKVLVPAVVYTIQNFLLYVAVENLPAATYMVTYQLKILTTAIFTVAVLKRKLSAQQWVALLFLFAGVAVVQYDQKMSDEREKALRAQMALSTPAPPSIEDAFTKLMDGASEVNGTVVSTTPPSILFGATPSAPPGRSNEQNSIVGFVAVLVACCLSGFAGIYFEKILKGSDVSIWIRNIQLALPSILFALIFAFVKDNAVIFADGGNPASVVGRLLYGFDWAVWVTVAISAFGGLVVAVVIKFADNILKAFATSFAIVLNCVLAYFLFSFSPTMLFVLGACMVISAVFVYSMYPYRASHQPVPMEEKGEELKGVSAKA